MKTLRICILMALAAIAGCGIPKPPPFYRSPPIQGAAPGTLISVEPYGNAVQGATAYRVLYNSTNIYGTTIPVSGVIFIPLAPPPPQGRNVVAWAHATTGVAQGCAPSLDDGGPGAFTVPESIPGLNQFISAGDIVAATDYPGLGAPGISPYLIGEGEGRSVIDSVRAARTLPGADMNGKFAVWGHSQGGQAALFTGQIAKTYAPELSLAGVAAAAPPTNLNIELTEAFRSNSGRLLAAYIYYTWSATYHVPITSIVAEQAIPGLNQTVTKCLQTLGQAISAINAAASLNPVFRSHDLQTTPPWPSLLTLNTPGHAPPGAPLLIVQGSADDTVEPNFARSFVADACARHEVVEYKEIDGVGHLTIAFKTIPTVTAWIENRFAGLKPPDSCKA